MDAGDAFDTMFFVLPFNITIFMRRFRRGACVSLGIFIGCFSDANAGGEGISSGFDSDELAGSLTPARRWLSHPGGRLCLNPSSPKEFRIDPLAPDLPLDLGGYVGTKIVRLPRVLTARLVAADGQELKLAAPVETWFPYRISFMSEAVQGASIHGSDFFPDAGPALIRQLRVKGPAGAKLVLAGSSRAVIGKSGNHPWLAVTSDESHYALSFRLLQGNEGVPAAVVEQPVKDGQGWKIELPASGEGISYAVGLGFATPDEGMETAVERANGVLSRPVEKSLGTAKQTMDAMLAKVPKPPAFGLTSPDHAVAREQHRAAYYMAWAFLFQSTINALPENREYPYPQMSLGKGALWAEGHPKCPATCGWESFLGIQWHSMIDPDFGWDAYEGIMSLVDDEGMLGGESLPSRKAHTAWVLFQQKADRNRLAAVYPAIRRYLLWRERNPRWIYGDNMAPDERDIEFAASWMVDVDYAVKIASALGLEEDATMWKGRQEEMRGSIRSWFFRDPAKLHQFYFTRQDVHSTPQRNEYRPVMILSALATSGLADDMRDRLMQLFLEIFKPETPNAGFLYTKYPDNQFVAWGLMDHKMPQARPFIEAILRDSILCTEFAEMIVIDETGAMAPGGVKPSLFTALNIIEFTWLLNGVRLETGRAEPFEFPSTPSKP